MTYSSAFQPSTGSASLPPPSPVKGRLRVRGGAKRLLTGLVNARYILLCTVGHLPREKWLLNNPILGGSDRKKSLDHHIGHRTPRCETLYSALAVPPSNSLVSVWDPWRAFWADTPFFKGRGPSRTSDANLDCAFVENALFLHWFLILKSQQNRIELVARPKMR